jgi:uncharacterized protein
MTAAFATRQPTDLSAAEARRIALAAQGFDRPRPTGRIDARAFRRIVDRLGLVQIDPINVFARAHYMPFFSRLGPFDRAALDRYLWDSGRHFEYMGHALSVIPLERYPLFRHRMEGGRRVVRWAERLRQDPQAAAIVERVRNEGPIAVSDVEGARLDSRWWTSESRLWLEGLFRTGQLAAVRDARTLSRRYDLPERVVPAQLLEAPHPMEEDAQRELARLAVRHLGISAARDVASYYALDVPTVKRLLRELVDAGEAEQVTVEGWREPAFLDPRARMPADIEARAILSPFDPVMWQRQRVARLFSFAYQIEIYVPAPKRVYGYYVLPFLLNDRLVARVDLKADRQAATLVVQSAHIESGADPAEVASELATELWTAAEWLSLERVQVASNGALAAPLKRAVAARRKERWPGDDYALCGRQP